MESHIGVDFFNFNFILKGIFVESDSIVENSNGLKLQNPVDSISDYVGAFCLDEDQISNLVVLE